MVRFIALRLAHSLFVVWGAYTVAFFLLEALPSDALSIKLGTAASGLTVPPEQLAELRHQYGYDQPLVLRYFADLGHVLTGNLGTSIDTGAPVTTILAQALPPTLALTLLAVVIGVLAGLVLGTVAAYAPSRRVREIVLTITPLGNSIPTFTVGLVLIQIFAFGLRWFPSGGIKTASSVVLPAITLALPVVAVITQIFAKSLIRTLGDDFVRTAVAKGATWPRLHFRHALRNSISPTLTLAGVITGNLLAGTVVAESVFSRPGLGRAAVDAIDKQDLPVLQAIVLLSAVVFVVINLIVDLLLPVVDPRLAALGGRARSRAVTEAELVTP
jgi:peptide/nickel transport system permease protein